MIELCDSPALLSQFCHTNFEKALVEFPFAFARAHWVSRDSNGKINGRISANLSERDPSRGYIGFYRCEVEGSLARDVSRALLTTAEAWLKGKGAKIAYGPVHYSTWFPYRFLTHSTSPLRFDWEPHQPDVYIEQWSHQGYEPADLYHSKAYLKLSSVLPKTEAKYQGFLAQGFKVRPMQLREHRERELVAIGRINKGSFQASFLSEPLGADVYQALYVQQFYHYLSDYCFFILNPEGSEVGYFFLFEDQGYLVWKTLAILPEYQGQGISSFGIHHAILLAKDRGLDRMISALIRKGAQSEVLLQKVFELEWEHEYTVFKKELS